MAGCSLLDRLLNMAGRPSSTYDAIYSHQTSAPCWHGGTRGLLTAADWTGGIAWRRAGHSPANKNSCGLHDVTVESKFATSKMLKDLTTEDCAPNSKTPNSSAIPSQSLLLQLPERVNELKPESDLTPIPGILKPQHHATDVEPDQS
ncbi:Hypothetical predicted protein [Xyrichtys novacula]|uniref:Prolactin receptor n=1 Tax=Xyrichtys novacula TaxID=13765 RepID=A0AAV1GHB9_XYRNO|nr:Hypothetical predicted protein [Xyrichtys novacula]